MENNFGKSIVSKGAHKNALHEHWAKPEQNRQYWLNSIQVAEVCAALLISLVKKI